MLPGYRVIGLRGWDDFIVEDTLGLTFTAPTVPGDLKYLAPYLLPSGGCSLQPDERLTGKIKWYVTPIVFGGDPRLKENIVWVTRDEHIKAVRWWNAVYHDVADRSLH